MEKKIILQKIPVKILIDALTEIYDNGANFVDIIGVPNIDQDTIGLAIRNEYLLEEDDEDDYEEDEEYITEKKIILTDNDINKLLDE